MLTTLVRSLVEFGHGCGVRVVAEGVETAGDAAALRALGVDYGQGWHFGRPGPADQLASCGGIREQDSRTASGSPMAARARSEGELSRMASSSASTASLLLRTTTRTRSCGAQAQNARKPSLSPEWYTAGKPASGPTNQP